MAIILKSRRELLAMRRTGTLGFQILRRLEQAVAPGVTTLELHDIAAVELARAGARGMSKNYPTYVEGEGYPAHMCISVNEEVVHGIPGSRPLKEGDVVTLDLGLMLDGYCADTAITVGVGQVAPRVQKLLDVTKGTLDLAISLCKPGIKWSEIARTLQQNVEKHGFGVVREFVGHGVGRSMHEDPKVPNFFSQEQLKGDFRLRPGMTIAVEPMVVAGRRDVVLLEDQWTVVTEDRKPAAHFEHTVAITEDGCEILTDGNPEPVRYVNSAASTTGPAPAVPLATAR
jgi:methionyl aminopeptidase